MLWANPSTSLNSSTLADIVEDCDTRFGLVIDKSAGFRKIVIDRSVGWVKLSCLVDVK